jgi:hypothetical protein
MAQSSILGGQRAPAHARGKDADALGPSDSSDSGSDVQGERAHTASDATDAGAIPAERSSDTDASGTGERGAAFGDDVDEGADILPDRVEGSVGDALDADTLDIDELGDIALEESDEESEAGESAGR